jgi:rhodanese-related sulfurtransferase
MAYSLKFQALADIAQARVSAVDPAEEASLLAKGAVALDIRDSEEHAAGHIPGALQVSRGKLEMTIEAALPDPETVILCYCNANNRGALSAATLQDMGYRNAHYIAGGLNAWRKLAEPAAG